MKLPPPIDYEPPPKPRPAPAKTRHVNAGSVRFMRVTVGNPANWNAPGDFACQADDGSTYYINASQLLTQDNVTHGDFNARV